MNKRIHIFWFRRDLRLFDNHGFLKALQNDELVLPIFIFDKEILDKLPKNDARVSFIHETLTSMNETLKLKNKGISIYYGQPLSIFTELKNNFEIASIYTNHDYEPYARERDEQVRDFCNQNSIEFKTFKDQVFFEKNDIVKADGNPYLVYTPYKNKWKETFHKTDLNSYESETLLDNCVNDFSFNWVRLEDMGFEESLIKVLPYKATPDLIEGYEDTRNFPAIDYGTSKLGPHLRFGTVSVRQMIQKAIAQKNEIFWSELIWREFFMQILWHYPHTLTNAFKPKYDAIQWRNNKEEFERWKQGKTGYPLVDAGMRELNTTGYMHNRVRMLVGSFLCKHLLIDWRWGEAYFAEKLLDYDMSANIGNWQWVAGTGVDAAPYFRIFNPTTQIQKFDKQHLYIKKWVKDLEELTYPTPMIDHKMARERCLQTYKAAVS